jgi:hypothetical protein
MARSQWSDGELSVHKSLSTYSECWSNGYNVPNDYIAFPWRSSMCCCSDIPTKLQFCKFSFCEVPSGTFCNFSVLALFLLSFLAFFPVRFLSVGLFPFRFLSSFGIGTSLYWDSFLRFEGDPSSLSGIGTSIFCGSSSVLATSTSRSLVLNSFNLFFYSSIKCVILLVVLAFGSHSWIASRSRARSPSVLMSRFVLKGDQMEGNSKQCRISSETRPGMHERVRS